ncbi:MAG: tRNA (N(6)-L-threonylcarbamoyladenosine(37)-C(2))-methylthiotransferase MtaB [Bacilli bacterium]|nr:tRNA (N(6)-L-threonylcarbamoyladenosine(37)-C(2))-methylthiotransferase MtaB [Bacilli bacterium]
MLRFYTFSLGCKVNSYENDQLRDALSRRGDVAVDDPEDADVIVLNTCSVTGMADKKSRQHARHFRTINPDAVLVVMGCYSFSHAKETLECGANIVLGTTNRKKIPEYIDTFLANKEPIIDVKPSVRNELFEEMGQVSAGENTRAYLKVQDGCDNYCTYCIIPTLRGNSRSRDPENTIHEAIRMVDRGYKEIVITGVHISAYGKDLGDGSYRMGDLLEDIVKACPDLYRLRISSIEDSEIDDKMLNLLKNNKTIVSHLHMPLQSGSDTVLKRMNRKYDTKYFLETLNKIRNARPDIAITTDVIVGFPGETEEEFLETMEFCKKANFAEIHVFPFSARQGTPAARMKDTPPAVKKDRVHRLLDLSKKLRAEYESKYFGQELEVLFEDYDEKRHKARGHTGNYLLVEVDSDRSLHGEIKPVIYTMSNKAD